MSWIDCGAPPSRVTISTPFFVATATRKPIVEGFRRLGQMQRLRRQDAEEERDGIVIFAVERTAFVETPESDRRAFAVLNDERQRHHFCQREFAADEALVPRPIWTTSLITRS